ncbi:hypothetical protein [Paenibacillus sp. BJ-4]|nr:hypothetical protein [Paenibacillus sp. BJ-4]
MSEPTNRLDEELQREVMAWEVERNQAQKSVNWQFTTEQREEN